MQGLWISPEGQIIQVVEHLIALQKEPRAFGLTLSDVRGQDVAGLRRIAEGLIADGWIRYRYLAGTHYIEIGRMDRERLETVLFDILEDPPLEHERVVIEVARPRREYVGTVKGFTDGTMFRSWERNPKRGWRFSR